MSAGTVSLDQGSADPSLAVLGGEISPRPGRLGSAEATGVDEETVITAELDLSRLAEIRASLPSLANRRPAAYAWEGALSVAR